MCVCVCVCVCTNSCDVVQKCTPQPEASLVALGFATSERKPQIRTSFISPLRPYQSGVPITPYPTHTHTHTLTHTPTYTHIHIHTHTHTRAHTRTHTHTHTFYVHQCM